MIPRLCAVGDVDLNVAIGSEAAVALPVIARALTGDPAGLARPEALPPWDDDDPELIVDAAEDEDDFHATKELLLDELEEYATEAFAPGGAVWRNGDFVASAMFEYKGVYGDGRLGRWTADDLAEFLLEHWPKDLHTRGDHGRRARVRDRFPTLPRRARKPFRRAARTTRTGVHGASGAVHRRGHRPAWLGSRQVAGDADAGGGIDLSDQEAVDAWISQFNSRPRADRDAVVGGALERMLGRAEPYPDSDPQRASKRPASERRTQRKKQRAARKRNRHR